MSMGMINVYRYIKNRTKEMGSYYILISITGLEAFFFITSLIISYSFCQHVQLVEVVT